MQLHVAVVLALALASSTLAEDSTPSRFRPAPVAIDSRTEDLQAVTSEIESSPEGRACVLVRVRDAGPCPPASLKAHRERISSGQGTLIKALGEKLPEDAYEVRYRYVNAPALCLRIDGRALETLARLPQVEAIALDTPISGALDTSRAYLGVDTVHSDHGLTGAGTTVAVLDTGIDTDHPDLSDNLATGAYHFLGAGADTGPGAEDDHGHGTFVSGIITSKGAVAPKGVAPDADVLAIKVLDSTNSGFTSDWIAGVDHIITVHENYADLVAINMSLQDLVLYDECPCDDRTTAGRTLQDLFEIARFEGIVPFACSGNQGSCGSLTLPGCLSGAVSVGAVDVRGESPSIASFTNRSSCLELLAPGVGILSTWIGGGTNTGSGCSYATPFAAATAALMAESCLTPGEVSSVMTSTGDPLANACLTPSAPILDALDAVVEAETIYAASDEDCDGNSILDRCELDGADCDGNGILDTCDLANGSPDCNQNGQLDVCEPDCNGNGIPDDCDIATLTSEDCDSDGIPDECETAAPGQFVRGNAQGSPVTPFAPFQSISLADGVFTLQYLFQDGETPPCLDASDANDDGRVNLLDAVFLFRFLIDGTLSVPHPYWILDVDPTPDGLDCAEPPAFLQC